MRYGLFDPRKVRGQHFDSDPEGGDDWKETFKGFFTPLTEEIKGLRADLQAEREERATVLGTPASETTPPPARVDPTPTATTTPAPTASPAADKPPGWKKGGGGMPWQRNRSGGSTGQP